MNDENVMGVIGGSGLYALDVIKDLKEVAVETPFGSPSTNPMVGFYKDHKIVFIPRHGKKHTITPSQINYRANLYAMKALGAKWILSVSAVGSLKEEIVPGHMVIVDQFLDRTKNRPSTFFGDGIVGHVPFGNPVCPVLADAIATACEKADVPFHKGGTYVCMEGPAFSTRAESEMYRSFGASVIGMTNLPEAKLAREAEMAYATLAMATDYDCWREGEEDVTGMAVVEVLKKNVENSKRVFLKLIDNLPSGKSPFHDVLKASIVTAKEDISEATKKKYAVLFGDHLE